VKKKNSFLCLSLLPRADVVERSSLQSFFHKQQRHRFRNCVTVVVVDVVDVIVVIVNVIVIVIVVLFQF
jgi:hypothetical protein